MGFPIPALSMTSVEFVEAIPILAWVATGFVRLTASFLPSVSLVLDQCIPFGRPGPAVFFRYFPSPFQRSSRLPVSATLTTLRPYTYPYFAPLLIRLPLTSPSPNTFTTPIHRLILAMAQVPNSGMERDECGVCDGAGPSGCDNQCGSTKENVGCGCGEPGPLPTHPTPTHTLSSASAPAPMWCDLCGVCTSRRSHWQIVVHTHPPVS